MIYFSQIRLNFDPRTVSDRGNYGTQWIHVHRHCCDRFSRFIRIWYVLWVCSVHLLLIKKKDRPKKRENKKQNEPFKVQNFWIRWHQQSVSVFYLCVTNMEIHSTTKEQENRQWIQFKNHSIIRSIIEMSEPVKMTRQTETQSIAKLTAVISRSSNRNVWLIVLLHLLLRKHMIISFSSSLPLLLLVFVSKMMHKTNQHKMEYGCSSLCYAITWEIWSV